MMNKKQCITGLSIVCILTFTQGCEERISQQPEAGQADVDKEFHNEKNIPSYAEVHNLKPGPGYTAKLIEGKLYLKLNGNENAEYFGPFKKIWRLEYQYHSDRYKNLLQTEHRVTTDDFKTWYHCSPNVKSFRTIVSMSDALKDQLSKE